MDGDPHKPLRDDVRLLGELLGDTLRAHEGEELFARVEEVRALAKRAHAGDAAAFESLADRLADMPIGAAVPIARAFSHFLTLANIAEQHHRVRRRRDYARDRVHAPQPGSCAEAFARWRRGGLAPDAAGGGRSDAANRAGAHGAPHRGGPPDAAADAPPHRRRAGRAATART